MRLQTGFDRRVNWRDAVTKGGAPYHTDHDGTPYWVEDSAFAFTRSEAESIMEAAAACWKMYKQAMDRIATDVDRLQLFGFRKELAMAIRNSWARDTDNLFGRFDFIMKPDGGIKLLEFNAHTPAMQPECAVAQWDWFEYQRDVGALPQGADQCNDIWEMLVEQWRLCGLDKHKPVYIATAWEEGGEDMCNASLNCDAALEAGYKAVLIDIDNDITLADHDGQFYFTPYITEEWLAATPQEYQDFIASLVGTPIEQMMMYFPWEWSILPDENNELAGFAGALIRNIENRSIRVIEPLHTVLMSSKLMLAVLAEMFPESPYVLDATFGHDVTVPMKLHGYVEKPAFSWEGSNITVYDPDGNVLASTEGNFGHDGLRILQEYCESQGLNDADGDTHYPILGVWVIGGKPAGFGVRTSTKSSFTFGQSAPVTTKNARFVPHYVEA